MGCGSSSERGTLQTVDDSVHVMLKHDKKVSQKKGEAPKGYVPRAEHPLLAQQKQQEQQQQQQPPPPQDKTETKQ